MSAPVEVTDHAVLRYLERVCGLDVETLRTKISVGCSRGAAAGAPVIRFSGARFLLRGVTVVTAICDADICGHATMRDLILHPERGQPKRNRPDAEEGLTDE
ncbi:MAG: hypothetical protein P1V13_22270 [Rhizobiaceae bacterium]|nr:hypothetical protein [Rhizobiaceae bacterium]